MSKFSPQPGRKVLEKQLGGKEYVDRLLSYIEVDDDWECWKWLKCTDGAGYGAFRSAFKTVKAHRMVATLCLSSVELVPTQHVMHECDNPGCCNPHHLKIASHKENMQDMFAKNRRRASTRNDNNAVARLTQSQVHRILALHVPGSRKKGERTSDLAKRFGITRQHVNQLVRQARPEYS